ncbi:hypothetical protein CYY_008044 [Polysphondylium violaceum]|uniref:Uncharacterized protein n=1 Tax=Polysphondylium violaceum TaxID=133409 RepID=A0A8J4V4D8_9MYCE|nr:hypothetical protein CYY_008044 [Polysphondylium violaceum]
MNKTIGPPTIIPSNGSVNSPSHNTNGGGGPNTATSFYLRALDQQMSEKDLLELLKQSPTPTPQFVNSFSSCLNSEINSSQQQQQQQQQQTQHQQQHQQQHQYQSTATVIPPSLPNNVNSVNNKQFKK